MTKTKILLISLLFLITLFLIMILIIVTSKTSNTILSRKIDKIMTKAEFRHAWFPKKIWLE